MDREIDLSLEFSPKQLAINAKNANFSIKVDPACLFGYISRTREEFKNQKSIDIPAYRETLAKCLLIANQLLEMIIIVDEEYILNEYWEETDTGRIHGHGLSLQRIPDVIRHATLGRCNKYEIFASGYRIMASWALVINPELQVGSISSYIHNQAPLRGQIASALRLHNNQVNKIFDIMGFNSDGTVSPYIELRDYLGEGCMNSLMDIKEFMHLWGDMETVRTTILTAYSDEFSIMGIQYNKYDPTGNPLKRRVRTPQQKLLWIYQALESFVLSQLMAHTHTNGHQHLLSTHNGVYFKEKLPVSMISDIVLHLKSTFPLINISHRKIYPLTTDEEHNKATIEYDALVETHRKMIESDERFVNRRILAIPTIPSEYMPDINLLNPDLVPTLGARINFDL